MNYVVLGLAYGDEGKGTIVDYLCRELNIRNVVRFSGGPQASHHVVLPTPLAHGMTNWHGFSQWGSGTFAGAATYINQHMLIEPYAMFNEAERLFSQCGIQNPFPMLTVHPDALVITPWHWRMNRLRETQRGEKRHGSCGMGVGEAVQDNLINCDGIRAKDLINPSYAQLWRIRERLLSQIDCGHVDGDRNLIAEINVESVWADYTRMAQSIQISEDAYTGGKDVIFEGSQGLMLDELLGFAPYQTWSNLVPSYKTGVPEEKYVIGVVPCIWTRHGAGPFVTEDESLRNEAVCGHNQTGPWQGAVRAGYFDLVALRNILLRVQIDAIAITKEDLVKWPMKVCIAYYYGKTVIDNLSGMTAQQLFECQPIYVEVHDSNQLGKLIGVPIKYISTGPTYTHKINLTKSRKSEELAQEIQK